MSKPVVLVFTEWYYPGFKAGGPIQSCINLVQALQGSIDFYIVSSNYDLGESNPYSGIIPNQWQTGRFGEQVWYANSGKISARQIREMIARIQPTAVYFNSMFSLNYTVLPLFLIRQYQSVKPVLAPRGMLHPGALKLKAGKKKIFLQLFRLLGLHKNLLFQATTNEEKQYILQSFPGTQIMEVGNIPAFRQEKPAAPIKIPGELNLVFLGRIHPTKNLLFLLNLLQQTSFQGQIHLEIIGEAGTDPYAEECRQRASTLPNQIQVKFSGAMPQALAFDQLLQAHFLVLPSLGENFGHAIFEALISGKPVLLSNQTPWRNLSATAAGWDIPLDQPNAFASALQAALDMNQQEYEKWSDAAFQLANNYFKEAAYNNRYLALFS